MGGVIGLESINISWRGKMVMSKLISDENYMVKETIILPDKGCLHIAWVTDSIWWS